MLLAGCTSLETLKFSADASLEMMKSSVNKKLKAQPAAGTGYVPMQQLAKIPNLPFDKAWIRQGVDWQRYRTIYIAPVNTDYLVRAAGGGASAPTRFNKMSKTWRPSCAYNSSRPFKMIPASACGW
jgi:hypothetical protein